MELPDSTVLLLIDVQQGFHDPSFGPRNNPGAEDNMAALLNAWRHHGRPVVHVQHLSTRETSVYYPGKSGVELQEFARPVGTEPLFTKRVNCAFVGTGLEDFLRARGYDTLVIVGISTDHCVSSTARMACDLGFTVYVVDDATATHDKVDHEGRRFPAEDVHRISLASLHGESATIIRTVDVLPNLSPPVMA